MLRQHNIEFGHFDILSDEDIRQSLKTWANWPTSARGDRGSIPALNDLEHLTKRGKAPAKQLSNTF